jgi:hypothetical protein
MGVSASLREVAANGSGLHRLLPASHFGTPMIVNGKVYLGTTKGIAVFGLLKR